MSSVKIKKMLVIDLVDSTYEIFRKLWNSGRITVWISVLSFRRQEVTPSKHRNYIQLAICPVGRSNWKVPTPVTRLSYESAAGSILGMRVRIPSGETILFCCECCALPGRVLGHRPIIRSEESYWMWCAWVRSGNLKLRSHDGCRAVNNLNAVEAKIKKS